ncbi:sel1 repeat family protein [Methylosinus sp. H3A]|uniref:tetratricopeptide repeat protein n=1 Tax=Methylosinus sp. H3A TaxID=2785786 RepID=UPI0018C22E26|nr:tetratricopeptide repeat protein [Methylosinus sp. H3A]MBG0810213.1 sel1 repeat family protein [Methylosinus sp. H3A]
MRFPPLIAICAILFFAVASAASGGVAEGEAALEAGDFPRAISELTPVAESGNAAAQSRLGLVYEMSGVSRMRDEARAARYWTSAFTWYSRAAEQNIVRAQRRVAELLRVGLGAPVDATKADEWDRRANAILRERAENGDADAQAALATAFDLGQGVVKDAKEAAKWRRTAARRGHAVAINALGVQYARGNGVEKDPVLAHALFAIAGRIARAKGEDDIAYRQNQDGSGARLSADQRNKALAIADQWRTGLDLPESSDKI